MKSAKGDERAAFFSQDGHHEILMLHVRASFAKVLRALLLIHLFVLASKYRSLHLQAMNNALRTTTTAEQSDQIPQPEITEISFLGWPTPFLPPRMERGLRNPFHEIFVKPTETTARSCLQTPCTISSHISIAEPSSSSGMSPPYI